MSSYIVITFDKKRSEISLVFTASQADRFLLVFDLVQLGRVRPCFSAIINNSRVKLSNPQLPNTDIPSTYVSRIRLIS